MRKQTKVAAVVSAAALLAIGASMTSFAKGWTVEDNEWVWLDSDDERVYGEWKKSVDGNYYWLDEEDGVMATNRIVEDENDTYYVGATGVRVTNDWVAVDNEDGLTVGLEDEEPTTIYYYMGSNGKAYKNTGDKEFLKRSIDGATYFFDENGIMQYGWLKYDGKYYYCGTEDQGWAYKGWLYVESETIPEIDDDDYDDDVWVYLDGGKLVVNDTKYIDKHYYSFNQFGVLETYWHDSFYAASAGIASGAKAYAYDEGVVGVLANGWVEADWEEDGDFKWYYMVSIKGDKTARAIPFNKGTGKKAAKLIDGKTYVFDKNGKMMTGKVTIENEVDPDDVDKLIGDASGEDFYGITSKKLAAGTYYFAKSNEGSIKKGQMLTGKVAHDNDGEIENYYFDKNGKALTNTIKDNVIYDENGIRLQAEDGNNYEIFDIKVAITDEKDKTVIPAGSQVVVSSTGKVRTSKTVTIDGEKYNITVDKKGESVWTVARDEEN